MRALHSRTHMALRAVHGGHSHDIAQQAKKYNNCIFHNVQRDLLVQTGDPTWRGTGGDSS